MSSPRPSSVFLCNADDESAEQPSDDTATMIDSEIQSEDGNFRPETTPTDTPIPPRPSHLEHPGNKNIRHGGDLMHEEVVLMTHPVGIVLQLLGPACLLLCELHQAFSSSRANFLRCSTLRLSASTRSALQPSKAILILGLVQLPTALRCTAAIMYQDFIRIFHSLGLSCNKGPRTPLPYQI
ncbi:hypothetical protein BKA60DRAFT_602813 [Fusarium oxysporum]|nr:hypothetical protein BKA60DRAFT_602813 [Fusarium oxysporum]